MPRINQDGKFILTAGEISSYVVCPHAWYLEQVKKVRPQHEPSQITGQKLHSDWENKVNSAVYYTWGARLIIYLVMLVILFFIFRKI